MEKLILFPIAFIVVYFVYAFLVIRKEDKLLKLKKSTEFMYLKNVYKVDFNKYDFKWLAKKVILTNCFIISLVVTIVSFMDSIVLMLLTGFGILIPSILIIYYLLAKYLKSK